MAPVSYPRSAAPGRKTESHIAAGDPSLDRRNQLLASSDLDMEQGRNGLNAKDENRMTPLVHALKEMKAQAATLLFDNNADAENIPNSRRSALHHAVEIAPPDGEDAWPLFCSS